MEASMEVDVENSGAASDSSPSSKCLGLKNTIHTNFGEDYVFQIASWYLDSHDFFLIRVLIC